MSKEYKIHVTSCAAHEHYFDLKLSQFVTGSSISGVFVFEIKSHVLALNSWHLSYLSLPGGGNRGVHHFLTAPVPFFERVE